MLQELFKRYKKEICSTCKAKECNKGICIVQGKILKVQCLDYVRDETKINKLEKPIIPTAKHTKPVMENLI